MYNVEATITFDYKDFNQCKNLIRKDKNRDKKGKIFAEDRFTCTREMYDYLNGNNMQRIVAVKLISIDKSGKRKKNK